MSASNRIESIQPAVLEWRKQLFLENPHYARDPRLQRNFFEDLLKTFHFKSFEKLQEKYQIDENRSIQVLSDDPYKEMIEKHLEILHAKIFANDCIMFGMPATVLSYWIPNTYFLGNLPLSYYCMVASIAAVALGIIVSLVLARFGNVEGFCASWEKEDLNAMKDDIQNIQIPCIEDVPEEKECEIDLLRRGKNDIIAFQRLPSREQIGTLTKEQIKNMPDLVRYHTWISLNKDLQQIFVQKLNKKLNIGWGNSWNPDKVNLGNIELNNKIFDLKSYLTSHKITFEENPLINCEFYFTPQKN